MNTIRPYLSLCFFFIILSCHAADKSTLTWKPNGKISDASGHSVKLKLRGNYLGKMHDKALYVAGFEIDKAGVNHPMLARISVDLKDVKYWNIDTIAKDFFIYKADLHVNDVNGNVYILVNSNMEKAKFTLKPNSTIIAANNDIVACFPSSMFKSVKDIGACYSDQKNWSVTVNWLDVTPKVCNNTLVAYEKNYDNSLIKKIDLNNGKLIDSIPVKAAPKNLCDLK